MPSKGISTRLRRFSTWAFAAAGAAGVAAAAKKNLLPLISFPRPVRVSS